MTSYNGFVSAHSTIDLFKGIEHVIDIQRNVDKRELMKHERDKILKQFVKACNRQQMVVLPNQKEKPFIVCPGDLYTETEGCLAKFQRLVERKLGRPMTPIELRYVKPQYSVITREKRAEINDGAVSWKAGIEKLKADILGLSGGRYGKNGHSKQGLRLDPLIKAGVLPKDYSRSFGNSDINVFDYHKEETKLRDSLKANKITHTAYNFQLKELRNYRKTIIEDVRNGFAKALRNEHKNSSAFHVASNIKGSDNVYRGSGTKVVYEDRQDGTINNVAIERVKPTTNQGMDNIPLAPDHWRAMLTNPNLDRGIVRQMIIIEKDGGAKASAETAELWTLYYQQQEHDRHAHLKELGI